jgi:hypothetical protein
MAGVEDSAHCATAVLKILDRLERLEGKRSRTAGRTVRLNDNEYIGIRAGELRLLLRALTRSDKI